MINCVTCLNGQYYLMTNKGVNDGVGTLRLTPIDDLTALATIVNGGKCKGGKKGGKGK